MNEPPEDVKRWTVRRKAAAVVDMPQRQDHCRRTRPLARPDPRLGRAVDGDFISMGTEALRAPRDAEARHQAREKDLLAKIGDLTMQVEFLQIARDYQGKSQPDANS